MLCLILRRGKTDCPSSLQQSGFHILTQRTSIVYKQHQGITLGGIIPFRNEEIVLYLHPIATRVGTLFKLLGYLPNQLFLRIAVAIRLQRSFGWLSIRAPGPRCSVWLAAGGAIRVLLELFWACAKPRSPTRTIIRTVLLFIIL